jgi:hypothetical protein
MTYDSIGRAGSKGPIKSWNFKEEDHHPSGKAEGIVKSGPGESNSDLDKMSKMS